MSALDYGKVRCPKCDTWYGLDESHTCPPSNLYLDAAMVAAWPEHDRMATSFADERAALAGEAYRARIAEENAYYAGLYGLVLTGRAAA